FGIESHAETCKRYILRPAPGITPSSTRYSSTFLMIGRLSVRCIAYSSRVGCCLFFPRTAGFHLKLTASTYANPTVGFLTGYHLSRIFRYVSGRSHLTTGRVIMDNESWPRWPTRVGFSSSIARLFG